MKIILGRLRRVASGIAVFLLTIILINPSVFAITAQQLKLPFYDPNASNCSTQSASTTGSSSSSTNSVWKSGLQPPYYLEEFAVEVLKDLAGKKGVPTSDAVTQEHVVALVAWAYSEGGNLTNSSDFNVWNMGFLNSRPDLFKGGGNADGSHTSFASFDAGVEGNSIQMTGSNQGRIGTILTQASSTAEQVDHAIAYYDETPGNLAWAWGNNPGDPASVLQFNHTAYISSLLDQLGNTRQNYAHSASVVIGPGEEESHYVDASKLQFSGGTGSGSSTGGSTTSGSNGCPNSAGSVNCTTAVGNAKILCEARKYDGIYYRYGGGHQGFDAFIAGCPDPSHPPDPPGNQPTGGAALDGGLSGNPSPCATDCSSLVSIAVDQAFGHKYMWIVAGNMVGAGAENWHSIPIEQATAGDIVTTPEHVEIVDHVAGSTIYTFGSHHTLAKTGLINTSLSNWVSGAWRWTDPGGGS